MAYQEKDISLEEFVSALNRMVEQAKKQTPEDLSQLPPTLALKHTSFSRSSYARLALGLSLAIIIASLPFVGYSTEQTSIDRPLVTLATVVAKVAESDPQIPEIHSQVELDGKLQAEHDLTRQYLTDYLTYDIGALFNQNKDRVWSIVLVEPLELAEFDPEGIEFNDFPTKTKAASRHVPTGLPDGEPQIKAWNYGDPIAKEQQLFVWEENVKTRREVDIWAIRMSDMGGWPKNHRKLRPEFYRVGSNMGRGGWNLAEWFVSFKPQEGNYYPSGYIPFSKRRVISTIKGADLIK